MASERSLQGGKAEWGHFPIGQASVTEDMGHCVHSTWHSARCVLEALEIDVGGGEGEKKGEGAGRAERESVPWPRLVQELPSSQRDRVSSSRSRKGFLELRFPLSYDTREVAQDIQARSPGNEMFCSIPGRTF